MNSILFSKHRSHVPVIKYILLMFFSMRIILSIIGVLSRKVLAVYGKDQSTWTKHAWLDIWGVWDTGWYIDISQHGYTPSSLHQVISQQTNIAFFPLYPLIMRFLGLATGNYYLAEEALNNGLLNVGFCRLEQLALEECYFLELRIL